MNRTAMIEGITLLVISLFGIFEGFNLNINRNSYTLSSMLGPGTYILVLSFGLMITALADLFFDYRKGFKTGKVALTKKKEPPVRRVVVYMIGVFAIYAFLIDIIGYSVPTVIFLLLEFRLLGVKSWKINIVVTSVVFACFYLVFIKYCDMIFPQGIFFN
jgi:putative tricarboxylic transport membrane protein